MAGRVFEYYFVPFKIGSKYYECGKKELAFLLNDERFLKIKQFQNKFIKHLGFALQFVKDKDKDGFHLFKYKIVIYDKSKLMLFRIKYGL